MEKFWLTKNNFYFINKRIFGRKFLFKHQILYLLSLEFNYIAGLFYQSQVRQLCKNLNTCGQGVDDQRVISLMPIYDWSKSLIKAKLSPINS